MDEFKQSKKESIMFLKNTMIAYPVLLITSIKKSFEALGVIIGKTGKTVCRLLKPAHEYYEVLLRLSIKEFATKKELILIFDETLIRKIYSRCKSLGYSSLNSLLSNPAWPISNASSCMT